MTMNNITNSSVNINNFDKTYLQTKQCTLCHQSKLLSEYTKCTRLSDGLYYQCKSCVSYQKKKYHEENKNKINLRKKKYNAENKDKISEYN